MISRLAAGLVTVVVLLQANVTGQQIIRVGGDVPQRLTVSQAEFGSMRHQAVTNESEPQKGVFGGVALIDLLKRAGVPAGDELDDEHLTRCAIVTGADGTQVTFSIAELDGGFTDRVVLVADTKDGKPLAADAGPYQLIVPGEKRQSRWIKRVIAVDVFDPGR
jgi:hypothetical protein